MMLFHSTICIYVYLPSVFDSSILYQPVIYNVVNKILTNIDPEGDPREDDDQNAGDEELDKVVA